MNAIVDPNSWPASEAAFCATYLGQLEAFMAEARVLTAERVSLGDTKPERQRKAAFTERVADLKGNMDAIQLCLDGADYIRAKRDGMVVPLPSTRPAEAAACATVPLQQQPKTKAFKMPDPKSFPCSVFYRVV